MADDADYTRYLADDDHPVHSTADVMALLAKTRGRWAGAFSEKPLPNAVEMLRQRQGGMLTNEQVEAGYGNPQRDVLTGVLPSAQMAAGGLLSYVPPEGWILASFLGPRAAANIAARGDLRPQRALEKAREVNTRMVAEGASLEDINVAISEATRKIMSEKSPTGKWRARNPETGRMRAVPKEESHYGDVIRAPSHLDNPPSRYGDEFTPAQIATREAHAKNPNFLFEVSDAGPKGLAIDYDALKSPWYKPWGKQKGTQTGVEGPYFTHQRLAEAYPELKDWKFTIEKNREGDYAIGGLTDQAKHRVEAKGRGPEERDHGHGYYRSSSRDDVIGGRTRRDLPAVLEHELTHVNLAQEGHAHTGGSPGHVMITDKWRNMWGGRNRDPFDEVFNVGGFSAHRDYEHMAPEWLANRAGNRVGYTGPELRKNPVMNPEHVGFADAPGREIAFPKKMRGESKEAFARRHDQYLSEMNAARKARERFPGDSGWTVPPTAGEEFRNYTLPLWWWRAKAAGLTGGAGYGVYALGKSIEEEPSGENLPTPRDVAESPIGRAILDERGKASTAKWVAAGRLGMHGVAAPFSPVGRWWARLGWGGAQAGMAKDAYDDMKKAEALRQLWEAQRRGYLNALPSLGDKPAD